MQSFIMKYQPLLNREKQDAFRRPLSAFFAYSFIWAFGGHYNKRAERYLDSMLREFFSKNQIPILDSVFEY